MKNFISILLLTLFIAIFYGNNFSQWSPVPNGWVDINGQVMTKDVDVTFHSKNGVARYKKGDFFGFVFTSNPDHVSQQYEALTDFNDGLAMAKIKGSWWIIDTLEQKKVEVKCHYAYQFSEGLARIQLGNRFGFIDASGKFVVPVKYFGAYDFSEGKARIYYNKKWGFIDRTGKMVVKPIYDYVWDFSNGFASVMKKDGRQENWGYINSKGVEEIVVKYGYVFPFSDDKGLVRKGELQSGKLFFVSKTGEFYSQLQYVDVFPFSEGLSTVYDGKHWGCINGEFEVVIPLKYDQPLNFRNGLALTSIQGKKLYVDKTGKEIWQEQ